MDDIKQNLNTNNLRLLTKLAENLNIDYISTGSNLKKMVDAFHSESNSIVNYSNDILNNMSLQTANEEYTELLGNQLGISRRRYSSCFVSKQDSAAYLKLNKTSSLIDLVQSEKIFSKGDSVVLSNGINITFAEDVIVSELNLEYPISLKISDSLGNNNFSIQANSTFEVIPSTESAKYLTSYATIVFKKPIGIVQLIENLSDYKARIQASIDESQLLSNSVLNVITREVPTILMIESDQIEKNGLAQKAYVYTEALVVQGFDDRIKSTLIPLLENNVQERCLQGTVFEFKEATPIQLTVEIHSSDENLSNSSLSEYLQAINKDLFYMKGAVSVDSIKQIIKAYLNNSSTYSEIIINLPSLYSTSVKNVTSVLDVPLGRFIKIQSITKTSEARLSEIVLLELLDSNNDKIDLKNNFKYYLLSDLKLRINKNPSIDINGVTVFVNNIKITAAELVFTVDWDNTIVIGFEKVSRDIPESAQLEFHVEYENQVSNILKLQNSGYLT